MKPLFLFFLALFTVYGSAQNAVYDAGSLSDTLYAKVHRIECKLFNGAIMGKIKAYKDDSLRSYYSIDELKQLSEVTTNKEYDPVTHQEHWLDKAIPRVFNPDLDGKGIGTFYGSATNDLYNSQQTFSIHSVAVLHAPYVGSTNIRLPVQPLFHASYNDLKNILSPPEIKTIVLLSNILMTDKYWMYPSNLDTVRIPAMYNSGFGINTGFKKFAFLKKDVIQFLSSSIMSQVFYVFNEKVYNYPMDYFYDVELKKKYSLPELRKVIFQEVPITLYRTEKDTVLAFDSIIMARHEESYYTNILVTPVSIGIETTSPEKTILYARRHDFESIMPIYIQLLITEN